MTTIQTLLDQQYGYRKWTSYDEVLNRLRCSRDQQFNQVLFDNVIDNGDFPIFACKFAQTKGYENLVGLANEGGKLAIVDVNNKIERFGIKAHDNAIFDIAWMFNNMKITTASGDHTLKLFDVTSTDIRQIRLFCGHNRSVKSISFRKDDPAVFASGGRDGNIVLWDTRCDNACPFLGRADRVIFNSHNLFLNNSNKRYNKKKSNSQSLTSSSRIKSVTGLVFQDDYSLISCGAGDGFIKIWDLRKNYSINKLDPSPKLKIPYYGNTSKNGFSSILFDDVTSKLYANCMDNVIYCYNLNNYNTEPIMKYIGHQNHTFYIKSSLSGDGNYLISGSSDENAYIWNVKKSKPFLKLCGHNAEVTCVAWCQNDTKILTCSDDMTHKIWKIGEEKLPDNWEIIGKGQAEMLPITPPTLKNKFKRFINNRLEQPTVKQFILHCSRCDNISDSDSIDSKKCKNCLNSKRKLSSPGTSQFLEEELNDLPNYVVDGNAPHLNFSPPKKRCQDWLTRIRIEKNILARNMDDLNSPVKRLKLDLTPKKKSDSNSRPQSPRHSRCASPKTQNNSPILRFFKQTNINSISYSNLNKNNNNTLTLSPRSYQ